jgi:hypothetical protein
MCAVARTDDQVLNDVTAIFLWRSGIHIPAAVQMVVDFGRGADHAAVQEDV